MTSKLYISWIGHLNCCNEGIETIVWLRAVDGAVDRPNPLDGSRGIGVML